MGSKREKGTEKAGIARAIDKRGLLRRSADRGDAEAMERADAILDETSAEIAAAHERMVLTQVEIERLKAENRELLAQSRRILEEIKKAA